MNLLRSFFFIGILAFLANCNDCEPVVPIGNEVKVELINLFGQNQPVGIFFSQINGLGLDSALYDSTVLNSFVLPLNRRSDTTAFVLSYDPELGRPDDTLAFAYRRFISINGPGCEAFVTFSKIGRSGQTTFDSLRIEKDFIDEDTTTVAIRIFIDPNDFIDVN